MTKVSVIIPVFNSQKYIKKCLQSIIGQTLEDIEIIIVDDCSTDETITIVQQIANENKSKPITIIHNETNCGVSISRNKGINIARGEFIYFCDNDDWIAIDMLEIMYNHAISYNSDLVMCDLIAVYPNRTEIIEVAYPSYSDKTTALKRYISSTWNSVCNIIAKRSLYENHKINFPAGLNMCEDYLVSTQLIYKANNPCHLPKALYYYNRTNTSSFLHNINESRRQMKIEVNLLAISFFKKEGSYENYKMELCWRLLESKQELCFRKETFEQFIKIYPESHKYILTCPYLSRKVKVTMWCLTHNLKAISIIATLFRRIKYMN